MEGTGQMLRLALSCQHPHVREIRRMQQIIFATVTYGFTNMNQFSDKKTNRVSFFFFFPGSSNVSKWGTDGDDKIQPISR